jgi:hypothetical protein
VLVSPKGETPVNFLEEGTVEADAFEALGYVPEGCQKKLVTVDRGDVVGDEEPFDLRPGAPEGRDEARCVGAGGDIGRQALVVQDRHSDGRLRLASPATRGAESS